MTAPRQFTRRKAGQTGPCVLCEGYKQYVVTGLPEASRSFTSRAAAQAWLEDRVAVLPPDRMRRERPCLCCKAVFVSDGVHNRLCDGCRKQDGGPVAMGILRPHRRGDGAAR